MDTQLQGNHDHEVGRKTRVRDPIFSEEVARGEGAWEARGNRMPARRPNLSLIVTDSIVTGGVGFIGSNLGLSTVSLRYGNVYGPRQDVHGEAGDVAIFCGHLVEGRRPTVFGDGRQTRDWVEVGDVDRANLFAADGDLTGPVNIGWGDETSVLELLDALGDVGGRFGSLGEPEFAPERPGEVRRSCLDVGRAKQELGWEAKTELREGLEGILAGL